MTEYTPCGGCGATEPLQRCIGCFHDFGGSGGSLTTARDDALDEAKQVAIRRRKEAAKNPHPDSIIREDEAEEIALAIEALKGKQR